MIFKSAWVVFTAVLFSAAPAFASGEFSHQYLTLDLPDGWSVGEVPAGSPDTIGMLTSSAIPGASITLDCYRGALNTHTSTRIRGLNTLAAALPAGQEQLSEPEKVKTSGGKGTMEKWHGNIPVGNMVVTLATPMAILKTRDCWLVGIGYAPDSSRDALQKDFEAIMKTAR